MPHKHNRKCRVQIIAVCFPSFKQLRDMRRITLQAYNQSNVGLWEKLQVLSVVNPIPLLFSKFLNRFYFAYCNGEMVGSCMAKRNLVHNLAVSPDYKGIGIASRLLEYIEQDFRERGLKHIVFYAYPRNHKRFAGLGYKWQEGNWFNKEII